MAERADELFAEYADAYARGDRPSSPDYLARAGTEADALAGLIDRFVASAPTQRPDESELAVMHAWLAGEPPLLELRRRRGIKRETVVDALVGLLGLDIGKRAKVRGYYHQLETGLLEPRRVDRRVWEVLGQTLRARAADIASWRYVPPQLEVALYQRGPESPMPAAALAAAGPEPEDDEIDRLFRGGAPADTSG